MNQRMSWCWRYVYQYINQFSSRSVDEWINIWDVSKVLKIVDWTSKWIRVTPPMDPNSTPTGPVPCQNRASEVPYAYLREISATPDVFEWVMTLSGKDFISPHPGPRKCPRKTSRGSINALRSPELGQQHGSQPRTGEFHVQVGRSDWTSNLCTARLNKRMHSGPKVSPTFSSRSYKKILSRSSGISGTSLKTRVNDLQCLDRVWIIERITLIITKQINHHISKYSQ